jgi:hypothetical protein
VNNLLLEKLKRFEELDLQLKNFQILMGLISIFLILCKKCIRQSFQLPTFRIELSLSPCIPLVTIKVAKGIWATHSMVLYL